MTNERRVVLTDQIVDAYIDLIDETGPAGPSVRALAARLFVSPATLYERVGPIGVVADLAAAQVRDSIARRIARLSEGDPAPIVDWVNANRHRALFATNPHRAGHAGSQPIRTDVLAVVGAFATVDADNIDVLGLVAATNCLPDREAIEADSNSTQPSTDQSAIVLDRIEDELLAASARLIATSGVDAWTFRSVAELINRSPSSLHATRPKSQVFVDLCAAVDVHAREVTAAATPGQRSGEIEACYFALGCHSVEREVYPAGPALPARDQAVRRYAIQIAANAPNPTSAVVAAGVTAFADALGALSADPSVGQSEGTSLIG